MHQWESHQEELISKIQTDFYSEKLSLEAVLQMKMAGKTKAGHYTSVLDVYTKNRHSIQTAINEVIDSYGEEGKSNEVLIQPQIEHITVSGVAFTRDINNNSPYYIINYEATGSTDGITSGSSKCHEKMIFLRTYTGPFEYDWTNSLLNALKEIELLLNYDSLDIEFAIDNTGKIFIFQVRPLVACATQKNQ